MGIDYTIENSRLENFTPTGEFWKPEPGQHTVIALGELIDAEPYMDEKEGAKPQAQIDVEVDGQKRLWKVPVGKTQASAYGQLIKLATQNKNSLLGVRFTLVVKNDGNKNDYTIVT